MTCIYEEFLMMLEIISCGTEKTYHFYHKNEKEINICALYFNYTNAYQKIYQCSLRMNACVFVLFLLFVI